jgi:dimethylaniline monooxygenase (N-oxide forming)
MICRNGGIGYLVSYTSSSSDIVEEWTCDAVVVCTRLHVVPNIPHTKGTQSIPKVLDSTEFKERSQLELGKMW